MIAPPTAQDFDGPPNPDESTMNLSVTAHGTVRVSFPIPTNFIELNYYQALELAKGLRKGCKKLLRAGFAVQGRAPSDDFPWSRFGLTPQFPDVPDTGDPPNEE